MYLLLRYEKEREAVKFLFGASLFCDLTSFIASSEITGSDPGEIPKHFFVGVLKIIYATRRQVTGRKIQTSQLPLAMGTVRPNSSAGARLAKTGIEITVYV